MTANAEIIEAREVLGAQAMLGEGSIWHQESRSLLWLDILRCELHVFDPATGADEVFPTGSYPGTVVPARDGSLLLALQDGIHRMDRSNGKMELLANPLPGPPIRFNDGKCDPSGRFWVGTLSMDGAQGKAQLFRFDADGSLREMLSGVSNSNGIVWTSDRRTMYYNDTPTRCVQAFDYNDASGNISRRRIAFPIAGGDGMPDGMTIDAEDKLWVALWGGSEVHRYDPLSGDLLARVQLPAPHVSSCAFGGEDLRTLFITTARSEMNDEELARFPQSGNLFAADAGVRGVPASLFG
jgi:sugar lactone lactonase YvrE